MNRSTIPFVIPSKFNPGVATGEIIRHGALLKDASTGRILAHVQETGGLQNLLQKALSSPLLGPLEFVMDLATIVQNEQIKSELAIMQSMLGRIQALQLATMVTSVAGIGVTVASTAIILRRLKAIDDTLKSIEEEIVRLRSELKANELQGVLTDVRVQVERMGEVDDRQDPRPVVQIVEGELHRYFNYLCNGIRVAVEAVSIDDESENKIDDRLLKSLLAGLALCGSTQFRALFWLDDKKTVRSRAHLQLNKLHELAMLMPRDVLERKLVGGGTTAEHISQIASDIRMQIASTHFLAEQLTQMNKSGRQYLEQAKQEETQPLLLLPVHKAEL